VKRLLLPILLGALLGLAIAAAWLGPSWWLDPERYRPQITAALAETLGRPIDIDGRLSVALLPQPRLTLRGVRLAGEPSALLEVAAVEVTLEPLALLQGRAAVTRLELDRPVLAAATLAEDAAGWVRRGSAGLGLERIVMRGGILVRRDEDRTPLLVGLAAEIEAADFGAPYRLTGEADWRSDGGATVPLGFDGSLGLPTAVATPVSLAVRVRDAKAELKLSGQLGRDALRGKMAVSGDNLNGLIQRLGAGFILPPAANAAFALQAAVDAGGASLHFDSLEGRIGDSRATGSVVVALGESPRATVTLSFANLDLDQWLAGAGRPIGPDRWRRLLHDLPLSLDVTADVLSVRQSVLRQARLDATVDGGMVRIAQAGAQLPGNSLLSSSGEIDLATATPRFDLRFEATSDNLRAVLDWLGVAVPQVPAERLRVLAVSGQLAGTASDMALSHLDLRIDTTHVSGAAALRLGDRLGIGVNLMATTLNLDAYWRHGTGAADSATWRAVLGGFDANVRATIGQMTVGETQLREVLIDGTLINGEINLRQAAVGELAGAALRLEGRIGGLARGQPELHGLRYDLRAAEPDKLARLLGLTLPFPAERLGRVTAGGVLDGDATLLSFQGQGDAAGTRLTVAGSVADLGQTPRWDVKLTARHDSLAALLRLMFPDYRPTAVLGGFALDTALAGTAAEIAASDLHARLGPVTVDGLAHLTMTGKPVITASLTAGAIDLNAFLAAGPAGRGWSKEAVDLSWLRGIDGSLALDAPALSYDRQRLEAPSLQLTLRDNVATLERMTATLGDGRLSASGRLTAEGAITLDAELLDVRLTSPLFRLGAYEVVGGRSAGTLQLQSEGRSPFEMLSRLSGAARLEVREGVLSGITLGEISQKLAKVSRPGDIGSLLQAGTSHGRTPFARLSGRFAINSGVVGTDDLVLEAEGGTATAVVTASLPQSTVDARLVFHLIDQPQAPSFVLKLDGPYDSPRRSFDSSDLESWISRRDAGKLEAEKVVDSARR